MALIFFLILILLVRGFWNSYCSGREIKGRMVRQCSVCHSSIPYGAEKCPYCHSKPGADAKAEWDTLGDRFALFIGNVVKLFVLLIVILLILSVL